MTAMCQRSRKSRAALIGIVMAAMVLALGTASAAAKPREARVISLDGAIGPATAAYAVRNLHAAETDGAAVVILRIDTPGGLDSAMRDIIRAILASPVPVIAYVAPGGARAASAGTYIVYAAGLAAMAPGTNIGAATPVSMFSPTALPDPLPAGDTAPRAPAASPSPAAARDAMMAKVTNDAVAYVRGLAALHGHNADWAEAAVREAASLSYEAALARHVIDLVAADVPDLLAKADGREVMAQGRAVRLATAGLEIIAVTPDGRDRLLGLLTDPSVVYLLLLGGLFAVAFEATHPGIYAPGVIGTICLLVGGYGLNLLPVDYAGLALVLLGVGLMVAETFIPAFGSFILGGATAFVVGSVMMFTGPGQALPPALVGGATVAGLVLFGVVLRLLMRARRRPVVTGTASLIGRTGTATAWTGPSGEVLVQGERWRGRAVAPLHAGQTIRVIGRDGLTLLVAPQQET